MKLTDFRQTWIDELRLEFALFLGFLDGHKPLSSLRIDEMALCNNKILLRLNHADPRFSSLVQRMTKAMQIATEETLSEENASERSELLIEMSGILKAEWERLKTDLVESETSRGPA